FDRHYKWKRAYLEQGGAHHPSDFVLFPDEDGGWRLLAIPDEAGTLGLKRPLPLEWAGLAGAELSRVVGVPGASFCHRNRFIAGFESESAARAAIARWRLDQEPEAAPPFEAP
ncbi:MAG TPA: MYG1 family protein, partial [Polyangiaceae bacterium]|nr:MYG1 family protein [Polyangiaceae bacterium]